METKTPMEQALYWMLMRRRQFLKPNFQVSMNNSLSEISWEEKAFAEDAAGSLGGCIWPPRSYSCSFCRREFRSAQALGGHMNVHRRDRARLKQSLGPNHEVDPDHQNHNPNPLKSSDPNKADSTLDSTDDFDRNSSTTTFSTSRVSALPTQENFSTSSIVQGQHKGKLFGSDSSAKRTLNNVVSGSDDNRVETYLSVGLNSVFFQNRPTYVNCGEEAIDYKRRKIAVSTLPILFSKEKHSSLQLQVFGLKPAAGSMEDLDLELKLGVQ